MLGPDAGVTIKPEFCLPKFKYFEPGSWSTIFPGPSPPSAPIGGGSTLSIDTIPARTSTPLESSIVQSDVTAILLAPTQTPVRRAVQKRITSLATGKLVSSTTC